MKFIRILLPVLLLIVCGFVTRAAAAFTVTNTNTDGPGSLDQALQDAAAQAGPDTITFDPALSGQTINPGQVLLIEQDVTIDATGLAVAPTLTGNGRRSIFWILQGIVAIKGLNLTGGSTNTSGGAIGNQAILTLEGCTFLGNTSTVFAANNGGGALFNTGSATLRNCTFFNNTAVVGPAIYNNFQGSMTLTNCTLSGNTCLYSYYGGAIYNEGGATLTHCTVAGNGDGTGGGGGIVNDTIGSLTLAHSIVARNTEGGAGRDIDQKGSIVLSGVNSIGDLSSSGLTASATLLTGDPILAALGNYGGPTQTMPPLAGSPAIDAAVGSSEASDQRGASRTSGNGIARDLGAVELGQIVVNTTADENNGVGTGGISLREAIAVNTPFQAELIRFDPAVFTGATPATNTITLSTLILVNKTLACVDARDIATGVTLSGDANHNGTHEAGDTSIFSVQANRTAALHALTLKDGYSTQGGAIQNAGTLTLTRCTLSDNTAEAGATGAGGAIVSNGNLALTHCTLSGNHAKGTNGIGGAIANGLSSVTLTHCTLSGNSALTSGGGLYVITAATLIDTIIAGNTAASGKDIFKEAAATVSASEVNFVGDPAGSGLTASATILTGDAKLAALASNGGATQTRALLSTSPARDAASGSTATADQRGFPIVGTADLGAYERQLGPIANLLLDEDQDTSAGGIAFPVGRIGTLSGSSSVPALVSSITFAGSGAAHTVTVTPAPNANGNAIITITDTPSGETQTFALTVTAVNDAPVFTKGADQTVFVDAAAQTITGWATGISAGPADESGQMLHFNVSNDNNALFATQPAVAPNGTLTFTPAAGVHGFATVTVTLSDDGSNLAPNVNTSAEQIFFIAVRLVNPESTKVLAAGGATPDAAPGASNNNVGLPTDAVLASLQTPATDDAGDVAFIAKWAGTVGGKKAKGTGLFFNGTCLAIVGGDASAIGFPGAKWKSFSDPVVSEGQVACIAKLSTGASAIVSNLSGAALEKVVISGEQGTDDGARFKSFKTVALVGHQVGFLAQLATGTGTAPKTSAANDIGLWLADSGGFSPQNLALREGDTAAGKTIKTLVSLLPGNGSPGCGRGYFISPGGGDAQVSALAIFTDRTQGLIFGDVFGIGIISLSGDAATGVDNGATFASYSLPARNASQTTTFLGKLAIANGVTKADASGIFIGPDLNGTFETVVRTGDGAGPAGSGAKFGALKDPVLNASDFIAFPATVTGVKGLAAKTLWWKFPGGPLRLLAQGGGLNGEATDLPVGSQWKSFDSLAIAAGPIFAASLVPKTGDATTANASGVWAMDYNGTLRTLFRTGDQIDVGQPGTPVLKTVKSFTLLKATVGSTGVTRSFNYAGGVVWLATFTDKTQAIVATEVP